MKTFTSAVSSAPSLVPSRLGFCFASKLSLLLLALAFCLAPALHAQISLAKIGDEGTFIRMKPTVIDGKSYSVMIFDRAVIMLDQNGAAVGKYVANKCRALATNGDTIYVFGQRTNTFELIKLRYIPAETKFEVVKTPQPPPTNWGTQNSVDTDMCVTTLNKDGQPDVKIWAASPYSNIIEIARWSDPSREGDLKLDTIPTNGDGGTAKNYIRGTQTVSPQSHNYYHFNTANDVLLIQTLGIGYPVRLAEDADGKSFWLAATDGYTTDYYPIEVTQITRTGEFNIAGSPRLSDKKRANSGGFGGVALVDASELGGRAVVTDLQVDSNYVYTTNWSSAGLAKVYRIAKASFAAGRTNEEADIKSARIENTKGISINDSSLWVQPSGLALVNGRLTVCGQFGNNGLSFKITGSAAPGMTLAHVGVSNLFVATLKADFSAWENPVVIPGQYASTTQPTYEFRQTALTRANLDGSNLILASRFTTAGDAKFDTSTSGTYGGAGNAFGLLLSSKTNKIASKRYILDVEADGKEPNGTKLVAITGLTDVGGTPGFGILSTDAGDSVTVTFPEHVYQKADGSFLKPADVTEANIQGADVIARYRPSGYTLTREGDPQTEIGTSNSVSTVMTKNTNVTFHLIREYALTVSSNLTGLYGLNAVSNQTLGRPVPECKKHWIEENAQLTAEIDGTVPLLTEAGTQYIATGYVPTGILGTSREDFGGSGRQATKQFTMTGPGSVTYQWKVQHSITTNSSAPAGAGLPGIKHPGGVLTKSGIFWFDRGTEITVGATDGDSTDLALKGVMSATGTLASLDQKTRAELPAQFTDGGKTYRGLKVAKLEAGGTVVWDFGVAVFRQLVSLGSPVRIAPGSGDFTASDELTQAFADMVNLTIQPKLVSVVNSPPNTTADNAMRWSKFDQKAYLVRPGRYLLEWTTKTSGKLTTEVTSGFPGDTVRHPYFLSPKAALLPVPAAGDVKVSSEYSTAFAVKNLFDGTPVEGSNAGMGSEFASNNAQSIVIQMDMRVPTTANALGYAQRASFASEKTTKIELWFSDLDNGTNVPSRGADATVAITNTSNINFTIYPFPGGASFTGRFVQMRFTGNGNHGGSEMRLLGTSILQKTYPGAVRTLRALLHPDMPAIDLDPDATDDTFFEDVPYSAALDPTSGTNVEKVEDLAAPKVSPEVANHLLSIPVAADSLSDGEGKHIVVFRRRADNAPATGDADKESLVVRVLETRKWNAEKGWGIPAPRVPTNKALSLNGSSAYVKTSLKSLAGDAFTIQFWFKGNNIQSAVRQELSFDYIRACSLDRKLMVSVMPDPAGAGSIQLPTSVQDGNWHLITMAWQRNRIGGFRGYVDGVLQGSALNTPDRAIPNIDTDVLFGSNNGGAQYSLGKLDEVSIWNRALAESEVKSFANKTYLNGDESGLLGYWTFEDGLPRDVTGHGYSGSFVSGALVENASDFVPKHAEQDLGNPMVITGGSSTIGKKITDTLDYAGIGTGFVTGAKARYNVDLHDNSKVADAGPIFPVNRVFGGTTEDELTVVWYERRDGVLWPWRPRKFDVQWPTNPPRIVIASQLGSDGLSSTATTYPYLKNPQPKFDSATTSNLKVYVQNDPSRAGFNPNEEHALVAGSLKFAAQAPQPDAVYALQNDFNVTTQDANYTSDPYVLAEYTNTLTGQPEMAVYKMELSDSIPKYDLDCRSLYKEGSDVVFKSSSSFLQEEPVMVRVTAGSLEGVSSGQTLYTISTGGALKLSLSPGGPPITTTAASLSSVNITLTRLYPYDFTYLATAGLPVPFPNPLTGVIGAVPPGEISGGEEESFTSVDSPTPKVYFEDYKGLPWAISGGPTTDTTGAKFYTRFYYRMQDSFWHKRKADKTKAGTTDPGTQTLAGTPIAWLPTDTAGKDALKVSYTAQWPDDAPVLKVGETLTFSGGEYKADDPSAPGLPGVIGWASGRVVFDSLTPSMDKEMAASASAGDRATARQRTFTNYSARLISPLEMRYVALGTAPVGWDEKKFGTFPGLGWDAVKIGSFKDQIAPATRIVTVDGAVWRFAKLPASLRSRIFFDPIGNRLGIQGFVNDKTLGDQTLTASPPPAYILDPNILRPADLKQLKEFKANPAEDSTLDTLIGGTDWTTVVDALYKNSRNPAKLRKDPTTTSPEDAYYTGLDWAPQRDADGNVLKYAGNKTLPTGALATDVPIGFVPVEGKPVPTKFRAAPANLLGPGLALVPSPMLLDPTPPDQAMKNIINGQFSTLNSSLYVTVAENDDPALGLPVSMHVIKIVKKHRYRGAIKLVEGDNAFSEKVTLRHTGDFGGNTDDLKFEWFYRPDDGRKVAVPYADGKNLGSWQLFPDMSTAQLDFNASGVYVLPDMWFMARYRHTRDLPAPPSWANTKWAEQGKVDAKERQPVGELWAGAANSPQPNGEYLPQLVPGWLKRVLDRINPYEARFTDFRNNSAPATYASMIQQAGPAYNGPVALNPNKDVIENTGLIQLYQTLLERAGNFGLTSTISDAALQSAVMNAIQLAATRVQDLYMVLGNEAYADSQDPLIGFGSDSAAYGSSAASVWTFMNQTANPLEEELALLRGGSFSFGRPVHNRLFWNFTKDLGEVAYAQTYNLSDENGDGFIDEKDAMIRYPMGHGDAWGHYSTAVKMHYDLLKNKYFVWQPRSESYNLLDTVIPVDFYDERKFAFAAASRAKAGADIVSLTYRQRYTENPDGQWQGYVDVDTDRAWGVSEWSRRAGQAALLDWAVANSQLPAQAENRGAVKAISNLIPSDASKGYTLNLGAGMFLPKQDELLNPIRYLLTITDLQGNSQEIIFQPGGPSQSTSLSLSTVADNASSLTVSFTNGKPVPNLATANFSLAVYDRPEGIQKVDRTTVDSLDTIAREFARIENTVLDANGGLNPLGLAKDSVPFDIDPGQYTGRNGTQPVSHFEQIYERARKAVLNARVIFDGSTDALNATRQNQDSLDNYKKDVADRDRELRNRLIEVFGTPHEGNIGTGKPYPAGYNGPDLFFYPYVDVSDVSKETVPNAPTDSGVFSVNYAGFKGTIQANTDPRTSTDKVFSSVWTKYFSTDLPPFAQLQNISYTPLTLNLPVLAKGYAFKKPTDWGSRAQTGELQTLIGDLVQAETALDLSVADYSHYVADVSGAIDTLNARYESAVTNIDSLKHERQVIIGLGATRSFLQATAIVANSLVKSSQVTFEFLVNTVPTTVVLGTANGGNQLAPANAPGYLGIIAAQITAANIAKAAEISALALDTAFETAPYNVSISGAETEAVYEVRQQLIALKTMLQDEKSKRLAVFQAQEALRQASDAYRTKLNAGLDLVNERAEFNRRTAGAVQKYRYQDMTFRIFRNEGLDKYHAAFDLAAKYTWLAAKAYQYETNLPDNHPGSAATVLEDIVKARVVGDLQNGEPILSDGLANALATLRDNYSVLKGQLGLNNAQAEDTVISLRQELFRVAPHPTAAGAWLYYLNLSRRADLNQVPEFRRYCRPFAPAGTPQPGIVINLPIQITAGKNLFGFPLGAHDHVFDPSLFATKISGVGVWFENYNSNLYSATPRVYLVPAGSDAMLEPTSTTFEPRYWSVVDQRIPVPHQLGSSPLGLPDWRPVTDTLDGLPGEIRKFSSFRAYSGVSGGSVDTSQMTFDSRLVGRSVWNTRWLLIIPGQTLGADASANLDHLVGGIGFTDILLVFKTFGFSGN